jgi:hypothetical protein
MSKKYEHLIHKIEIFIRKYYKNQLIKGAIISFALWISFFLIISLLEYFFHLGKTFRKVFFYLYLGSAFTILMLYIVKPIAGLIRIGKRLSYVQAAKIIGEHFPNVSDRLLNTIELQNLLENKASENVFLLEAAIEQKSEKLSPIPFQSAIKFSVNKKYLIYLFPPLLIVLLITFFAPKYITESSERLINYNKEFAEKPPFEFIIKNEKLQCLQGENFELNVTIKGEIVPDEVLLVIDNYPFKIIKDNDVSFKYVFKNVIANKNFYFKSGKYKSQNYTLTIIPKPKILSFNVDAKYPKYIRKKDESFKNIGDLSIPEGTKLKWTFNTKDLSSLLMLFNNDSVNLENSAVETNFIKFNNSISYNIIPKNKYIPQPDTISYHIEIIKDQYPSIRVANYKDSLNDKIIYFQGYIKDDYGFSKLFFKWKKSGDSEYKNTSIPIHKGLNQQRFYYLLDIDSLQIEQGDNISYFFEVFDNDAINGHKSSKTILQSAHKSSNLELDSARNKIDSELKDAMKKNIVEAKKINKEVEKLQKKLVDKKQLDWQDKQQLKDLLNKYQQIQKNIEDIKKSQAKSQQKNKELSKEDERLLQKQKQLEELFDKLMTPEMKKMMEEMQKMMNEELKKDDAKKMLDQIQMDNKDLEKQLDRDLEMFKQMEFDQKLQEAISQLDSIKSKQDKIGEELDKNKESTEETLKKQEELNKEFEQFKEKLNDAKNANKELEKPNKMDDFEQEKKDVEEKMESSKEELSKGKKKSASKMQKSASESMQKLSDKLKQMQSNMEMESNAENMEDLKDILSNLIESSFNQENLMNSVKVTSHSDPKYPSLIRAQKDIKMDLIMIEDSLLALSKRQASISPMVNKEIGNINLNMKKTLESLLAINTIGPTSKRQKDLAVANQQQIMTSVNNLALMLSEALEQMQQQQMQAKSGKGNCKKPKPGQSGSSMKSIRQMQEALNKQMKKMQEQMKNGKGKQKGPKKGNGKQGSNGEKMSEELAKMAAQQEMIRQKLQSYQESLKKSGNGKQARDLNKTVKDMEQNETELVNSIILQESLMRQKEILTRLLEAEEAEREQKQDEKREAKEGKDVKRKYPPNIEEYLKQQNSEVELLKTIPPEMKPFYKNKVNKYLEQIKVH